MGLGLDSILRVVLHSRRSPCRSSRLRRRTWALIPSTVGLKCPCRLGPRCSTHSRRQCQRTTPAVSCNRLGSTAFRRRPRRSSLKRRPPIAPSPKIPPRITLVKLVLPRHPTVQSLTSISSFPTTARCRRSRLLPRTPFRANHRPLRAWHLPHTAPPAA